MNFILTISLCSFINSQCLTPVQIKADYASWKECVVSALVISKEIIIAQEDTFVNDNKVAIQFTCTKQEQI